MEVKSIPIDKIRPSPFQPRETFEKEKVAELTDSIKGGDLVQPILVRKKGDTYEIIAGERRWRAYQFAGLTEIPAIERDADDVETRELSFIENWHRLALEPIETEKFIAGLFEDGTKAGRYKSVKDMSKKTGIPRQTLEEIILAFYEKKELGATRGTLTYADMRETRLLKDKPELRRQVLKLREQGKLAQDKLREFSKVLTEVSEPVRSALLRVDSKLTPEEARIIDTELRTPDEKRRAIETLEREKSPERIKSLIQVIRLINEERLRKIEVTREIDTGDIWICPECNRKFHLIHVEPQGTHRFEEVIE
ncbi:ParB/RepB/Spo0J family partition protein [Dehalococcoidia bacterium]|nr:ParB/RepB/Spo0J family partition protein [Dehalococcoidia bacterium]